MNGTDNFRFSQTNVTPGATGPAIMGVINASPNSFFRPINNLDEALREADAMVQAGAGIIDVGGEATSPQVHLEKDAPSIQQELDRVIPVIEAIHKRFDCLLSVDTSSPEVMKEAVAAGAGMINDQRALSVGDAMRVASMLTVPICLMHFFTATRKIGRESPAELLERIKTDLTETVKRCEAAGIKRERLLIDPGFGQGNYQKNCDENCYLLAHLDEFRALGLPILVGWSRKSMIGDILNAAPEDRLYGSIAAAVMAVLQGASVIRVHDVKATADAIHVVNAILGMR